MVARNHNTSILGTPESRALDGAVRSAAWHVIPLLAVGYIVSYIDRANISFAALTMNKDLGLTATHFGFIAGTFYVGYCLFEIPSNVALSRGSVLVRGAGWLESWFPGGLRRLVPVWRRAQRAWHCSAS